MRSFGSLALVYLFTATTKWTHFLKSLKVLKIPASFMAIPEMTHRYIFLGLELAFNFGKNFADRVMVMNEQHGIAAVTNPETIFVDNLLLSEVNLI